MSIRKLVFGFTCLAAFALPMVVSAFSTSSYVQDGLIACWDGIENAGVGTHDNNATVWKSVVGGYEFDLTGVTVNADRMTFAGSTSSYGILSSNDTVSTFVAARNGTMEIVYRSNANPGTQVMLQSSNSSGIAFGMNGASTLLPNTYDGNVSRPKYTFTSGTTTNSVAVRYTDGVSASVVANGSSRTSPGNDYWWYPKSETYIGIRSNQNATFPGSIYCIRLYSRKLTDDEIAANQNIDRLRFMDDSSSALVVSSAPSGLGSPDPAYGLASGIAAGAAFEVSCGAPICTNAARTAEYRCVGWKLYNANDDVVDSGAGTSFTYTHPSPAEFRQLEWQWELSRRFSNFSDYVQDGLIACWDGICNVGIGVHADNVAVWKDVIRGCEFNLDNVAVGTNCMIFAGTKTGSYADSYGTLSAADTASTFLAATNGTMEIVYRLNGTGNQVLLQSSASAGIAFGIWGSGASFIAYSSNSEYKPNFTFSSGTDINSVSVRYASHSPESAIANGLKLSTGGSAYWGSPEAETYIGARASRSSELFAGSIYCIRLYDRQLTDMEIISNHEIDNLRFKSDDVADSMLVVSGTPEGIGAPSPGYGYVSDLLAGATRVVNCGEVPWTDATGTNTYSCAGWKLYDRNGEVVRSGSGKSFTYTHPTPAAWRWLEWQWREGLGPGLTIYVR